MPFVELENGRIQSLKLEFNLSFHCNFSCANCSHLSPHHAKSLASLDQFRRDVSALAKVYHVRRFCLVGGEPLLHGDILSFIDIIRDSGLTDVIQVCTNGALLHRTSDEVFRSIDILSISWYPDARVDEARIRSAKARCARTGTKLYIRPVRKFRKMNADSSGNPGLTAQIYSACQIAHSWYCQTFYDGMFYLCSRPLFTGALLEADGSNTQNFALQDGIPIHADKLFDRLVAYLRNDNPLASCHLCLGTVGKSVPWRALSARERSRAEVERNPLLVLDRRRLSYLLRATRIQRIMIRMIPSLWFVRVVTLLKDMPYRWSRAGF